VKHLDRDAGPQPSAADPEAERTPPDFGGVEPSLWADFRAADSPAKFLSSWLAIQCSLIRDVRGAVVTLGQPNRGPFTPAAIWPRIHGNVQDLTAAASRAVEERCGLVLRPQREPGPTDPARDRYEIAQPIEVAQSVYGAVALEVGPRPERELQAALRQLYWGLAWLEAFLRREDESSPGGSKHQLQTVLELSATVPEHERFREAATAFVTDLATRFKCDRVSVGFLQRRRIRLRAMSHSAQFGKKTNLVRSIEAAMEEVVDQGAPVVYPADPESLDQITRAHTELSAQSGAGAICSVPLIAGEEVRGALTLEREGERPFDWRAVELCEAIAAMAGPMLEVRRREDRLIFLKIFDSLSGQIAQLFGPHKVGAKLGALAAVALVVFLAFAKGDRRVTANTILEPAIKRAAVAPFNGYIAEAPFRAGDLVREGDLLVALDDRDLGLEHQKWMSRKQQLTKQYRKALAERDAAQLGILSAEIAQADTQLDLLQDQLSRTRIRAPFDGIVVTGDLSQSQGAPAEKGEVLFEIAPLDAYSLVLQVEERDVAAVAAGQSGSLVLSAFPDAPARFTVEKLTPVSEAKEGINYFRAEAKLEEAPERLRPGMEGVGKIEVGRRRLVWIWTHPLIDWVRLKLWRWSP
jgi:RND family efflux transporter MFP subunit